MIIQVFANIRDYFSARLVCAASMVVLLLLLPSISWGEDADDEPSRVAVGKVKLVLGKAYLQTPNVAEQALRPGMSIRVQDRITTTSNGHVHIEFVDQAFISVRPGSRLEVLRYDFNPGKPAASTVKFNLLEGVARSISGDAARNARERYRLNTPIAAIGVRGTDFVVSADANSVRALVNEGIIVVAPYSGDCLIEALGPCQANALELSQNSLQMIELEGTEPMPRMVPAVHEHSSDSLRGDVQLLTQEDANEDGNSAETDIAVENVTSQRLANEAASVSRPVEKPLDLTPDAPVPSQSLTRRQLVWGRWAGASDVEDVIALTVDAAIEGREISVAGSQFMLFRQEPDGKQVDRGLGVVSFSLNSAQATYANDDVAVPMQISGGRLDIDFVQRRFATELSMSHDLTGDVFFAADGKIQDGGYFHSRSESHSMAGAVSTDGREAGYFFEQQLLQGGIQGLTLWDQQ